MIGTIVGSVLALGVCYIIKEQFDMHRLKGKLKGPSFQLPLVGGLIEMVVDPEKFWTRQDGYGPVSWNFLMGKMMIHTTDPDLSRKVLSSDSPDKLKMKVHPNAELILGSNNIAFMQGAIHKELRVQVLPLFTRRALAHYVAIQDKVTSDYISTWLQTPGEQEFRWLARSLNTDTSQIVFVGPYLEETEKHKFHEDYQRMNDGFLSFPVNLPGTALNKAIKARKRIVASLTKMAARSKELMAAGGEPQCLLDYWMEKLVALIREAEETGGPLPMHHDNHEIACTLLDFLFASQDASTSSLVWTVAFMADHPEILARVREEQALIRPQDEPVTHEHLTQMTFTRQVVKEILRIRPPATLVPQEAQQDFQLTEDIVVPKGSLLTPSLWASSYYGYSNPHTFDPDRFSPERGEDTKHAKSFLVFGAGPHACLGKEYAINHLMTFLSLMSTRCEWTRRKTSMSDHVNFGPTIYPYDCLATLKPKVA